MNDTIEDICYEMHKVGKRELLLEVVLSVRKKHTKIPSVEVFQKAYDIIQNESNSND